MGRTSAVRVPEVGLGPSEAAGRTADTATVGRGPGPQLRGRSGKGWPAVVPAWASVGALGATLLIGAVAGLYPAVRAARLAPTAALAAP